MTEYKYIGDHVAFVGAQEIALGEIAYQLKRIADALESIDRSTV